MHRLLFQLHRSPVGCLSERLYDAGFAAEGVVGNVDVPDRIHRVLLQDFDPDVQAPRCEPLAVDRSGYLLYEVAVAGIGGRLIVPRAIIHRFLPKNRKPNYQPENKGRKC